MSSNSDEYEDSTRRSAKHKFKLVWWEEESKSCTAYGDKLWVDTASCLLHFEGSHGEILIPIRTMKFVVK